jgi:hypothetical protein
MGECVSFGAPCVWLLLPLTSSFGTHITYQAYETADGKLDTQKREAALLARYQEVRVCMYVCGYSRPKTLIISVSVRLASRYCTHLPDTTIPTQTTTNTPTHTHPPQEEQFKTEQELWEEQQVGVASFRPGAKDKGKKELRPEEAELEEFLFENQIDFVSDQVRGLLFVYGSIHISVCVCGLRLWMQKDARDPIPGTMDQPITHTHARTHTHDHTHMHTHTYTHTQTNKHTHTHTAPEEQPGGPGGKAEKEEEEAAARGGGGGGERDRVVVGGGGGGGGRVGGAGGVGRGEAHDGV